MVGPFGRNLEGTNFGYSVGVRLISSEVNGGHHLFFVQHTQPDGKRVEPCFASTYIEVDFVASTLGKS